MDLIYYYPMGEGAPSKVARSLFNYILLNKEKLSFDNVILFTSSKYKSHLRDQFKDISVLGLKDISKIKKEDVVHIPVSPLVFPNAKFLLHLFSRYKKSRVIINYHGDFRNEIKLKFKTDYKINVFNLLNYVLFPTLLSNAHVIVVNSILLKSLVTVKYGINNTYIIPNAINDDWFVDSDMSNEKLSSCTIFYHGRLSPEKGVDLLIEAFNMFLRTNPGSKVCLHIAGDGPQRKYLEDLSKKFGIEDQVQFLGHSTPLEIKRYLAVSSAAIYPSIFDSFSLAILEAFSCARCPVYFSRKAGIYDFTIKDGFSLNSFEPSIVNICDTITIISRGLDSSDVIRSQKQFSKNYSWNQVVNDYISLYEKVSSGEI